MKRAFEVSLLLKLRFAVSYVVKKRVEVAIPRGGEGSQVPPLVVNRWVEHDTEEQSAQAALRILKDVKVGASHVNTTGGALFVRFDCPENVFLGSLQIGEVRNMLWGGIVSTFTHARKE